jgi:exopolyphosphatase/guanosine-5'-triphosphate,3'-diphosphate pyrophosphatase
VRPEGVGFEAGRNATARHAPGTPLDPAWSSVPSPADRELVARSLGRMPRGSFEIAVRDRRDGRPVVIANPPLLPGGEPMPTRWWLVDPTLVRLVSRLESAGGVREAEASVDPAALQAAHARYAAERDALVPRDHRGARPAGGVGGTRVGVKCLHAHLAWWLVGGDDPVGAYVARRIGLDPSRYARCAPPMAADGCVAAVDCGTNSTRLLVADARGVPLVREMRITRLGEGVDRTGRLSEAAIERTLAVLEEYRQVMDRHGVVRARLVATSAARDAANADAFLAAAGATVGATPELLDGEQEGRLAFLGAVRGLAALDERGSDERMALASVGGVLLVVDIGGGSTELALGPADIAPARLDEVAVVSLDVGCVRLTERMLRSDPPTSAELAQARAFVDELLAGARAALARAWRASQQHGPFAAEPGDDATRGMAANRWPRRIVGLAGTVSTLVALARGVVRYERSALHHQVLERREVESWLERLAACSSAERAALPGMVAGREDVILGGAIVLERTLAAFQMDGVLASEDDILDGLVATLLEA